MKTIAVVLVFGYGLATPQIHGDLAYAEAKNGNEVQDKGVANENNPATVPRIRVSDDLHGFVLAQSGHPFVPWGFNYDHDETAACWRTTGRRNGPRSRPTSGR